METFQFFFPPPLPSLSTLKSKDDVKGWTSRSPTTTETYGVTPGSHGGPTRRTSVLSIGHEWSNGLTVLIR